MSTKSVLAGAALALSVLVAPANAATYTSTLPEFDYDGGPPFPTAEQIVGEFLYSIGAGETIVSATVSGTFGNSVVPNSAGVQLFGDGGFLGECIEFATCYDSQTATPFSFAVTALASLLDGAFVFSIIQTSEFITRLGEATLTIETRPSEVPIPAALPLLATGLGALGFAGWRRKRKAAAV